MRVAVARQRPLMAESGLSGRDGCQPADQGCLFGGRENQHSSAHMELRQASHPQTTDLNSISLSAKDLFAPSSALTWGAPVAMQPNGSPSLAAR